MIAGLDPGSYSDYLVGIFLDKAKRLGFSYWALSRDRRGFYHASVGDRTSSFESVSPTRHESIREAVRLAEQSCFKGEVMSTIYTQLSYDEYKELEKAISFLKETVHTTVSGFYHKSIRLPIGKDHWIEFHGPIVMAQESLGGEKN